RVDRPEHLTTVLPSGRALFLTRQLYPMAASSQFTASRERAESRKGGTRIALEATGAIVRSVAGCIRVQKSEDLFRGSCGCACEVPKRLVKIFHLPFRRSSGAGSSCGALHRGGVAPPERLASHASQGRLFQPRCRGIPSQCLGGLEQP